MHKLNNNWTCWIHKQNDRNWDISSYIKITSYDNLKDAIIFAENLDENLLKKSMIFFMKDDIKPLWEDNKNIKGGTFSYKITNDILNSVWKKLYYYIIGNTLIENTEILKKITGLSVSPKKNFCIIKLWIEDINQEIQKLIDDIADTDPFNIGKLCNIDNQICVFKKHEV
jgi:hypothetical protein